jgi:hypothetical protein
VLEQLLDELGVLDALRAEELRLGSLGLHDLAEVHAALDDRRCGPQLALDLVLGQRDLRHLAPRECRLELAVGKRRVGEAAGHVLPQPERQEGQREVGEEEAGRLGRSGTGAAALLLAGTLGRGGRPAPPGLFSGRPLAGALGRRAHRA